MKSEEKTPFMNKYSYRLVPHEQYIKTMIFAGLPLNEIVIGLNNKDYNKISDDKMKQIIKDCKSTPAGKDMIAKNEKIFLKDKVPPFMSEEVMETFKYKDMFYDLICLNIGYPDRRRYSLFYPVTSILKRQKERTFIEIAAIMNMTLDEIIQGWSRILNKKVKNHPKNTLACYYYYFWRATRTNMRDACADMADIACYLHSDTSNSFYFPHRYLAYAQPESLQGFMGIFTDDERTYLNKDVWGRCHLVIENALETNDFSIPQWVINEYARIDIELKEREGEEGKEYYRKQLERIFARITGKTRYNLTLDQIKNKRRIKRVAEKDQPYDLKRR